MFKMQRVSALIAIFAAMTGPAEATTDRGYAQLAQAADLHGTVLVARDGAVEFEEAFGFVDPELKNPHALGQIWRWASVTKQITATLVMQEVDAGRIDLDASIASYLPAVDGVTAQNVTVRMALQHVSGIRATEDGTVGDDGWSLFYTVPVNSPETGAQWCLSGPTKQLPADFRYGDCDYVVLGAVLEAVTQKSFAELLDERIASPLGLKTLGVFPNAQSTMPGFIDGKPEPTSFRLENFGAAGAVYGSMRDMLAFDMALMSGELLSNASRQIMWDGKPQYGYAAFGQWVFDSGITGCDAPVKIVERRGFIGGVVLRNIILPDHNVVIIIMSNRAEADAQFGEIWQQKGLPHDLISAAVCKGNS